MSAAARRWLQSAAEFHLTPWSDNGSNSQFLLGRRILHSLAQAHGLDLRWSGTPRESSPASASPEALQSGICSRFAWASPLPGNVMSMIVV